MRKRSIIAAASLAALSISATSAFAATTFDGGYTETHNTSDPGLIINTKAINSNFSFDLDQGQSTSVQLFKIFTNETSVNADDLASKVIDVEFAFTAPDAFGGGVSGTTSGQTAPLLFLQGFFQDGVVTWANNGNAVLDFGNGGELGVHLNDATFNSGGFFGLDGGKKFAATITADFTELKAASAVPEPATWATMMVGLFGVGAVLRRSKATAIVAA